MSEAHAPVALGQRIATADAVAAAYAEGLTDGETRATAALEAVHARLTTLTAAAQALLAPVPPDLGAALTETVLRLVERVVGESPVDAVRLRARADALIAAAHNTDARLFAHPDDAPLVDGARADPALAPGDLRLEDGDTVWTDGVGPALARVRTALGVAA